MATCRCGICGKKNAGKSKNGKLWNSHGVSMSEDSGRFVDYGSDKRKARKVLRTRMRRQIAQAVYEAQIEMEDF